MRVGTYMSTSYDRIRWWCSFCSNAVSWPKYSYDVFLCSANYLDVRAVTWPRERNYCAMMMFILKNLCIHGAVYERLIPNDITLNHLIVVMSICLISVSRHFSARSFFLKNKNLKSYTVLGMLVGQLLSVLLLTSVLPRSRRISFVTPRSWLLCTFVSLLRSCLPISFHLDTQHSQANNF